MPSSSVRSETARSPPLASISNNLKRETMGSRTGPLFYKKRELHGIMDSMTQDAVIADAMASAKDAIVMGPQSNMCKTIVKALGIDAVKAYELEHGRGRFFGMNRGSGGNPS